MRIKTEIKNKMSLFKLIVQNWEITYHLPHDSISRVTHNWKSFKLFYFNRGYVYTALSKKQTGLFMRYRINPLAQVIR